MPVHYLIINETYLFVKFLHFRYFSVFPPFPRETKTNLFNLIKYSNKKERNKKVSFERALLFYLSRFHSEKETQSIENKIFLKNIHKSGIVLLLLYSTVQP